MMRSAWYTGFPQTCSTPGGFKRFMAVASTEQPQLQATDLQRSFRIGSRRVEVLRGISLNIERGEAVFLCGASGAGKTTLLYTLAGLERPEFGEVVFEGRRLYRG